MKKYKLSIVILLIVLLFGGKKIVYAQDSILDFLPAILAATNSHATLVDVVKTNIQALSLTSNGNHLIFGGREGNLYQVDPNSGDFSEYIDINQKVSGLAFAQENIYYFSSTATDYIYRLDTETGSYTYFASTQFPDGVSFLNEQIYSVTDDNESEITVFDIDGNFIEYIDTGIADICGITSYQNYLYVLAETGDIYKTNPATGQSSRIVKNTIFPDYGDENLGLEGVAIHNGFLYVYFNSNESENHGLYKIEANL